MLIPVKQVLYQHSIHLIPGKLINKIVRNYQVFLELHCICLSFAAGFYDPYKRIIIYEKTDVREALANHMNCMCHFIVKMMDCGVIDNPNDPAYF